MSDLGSKIVNPGLIIIKTPMKPIKIASQVLNETYSLNIIADKATTMTGVKAAILWVSAKDKYLKDNTKHPASQIDKMLLRICKFILWLT